MNRRLSWLGLLLSLVGLGLGFATGLAGFAGEAGVAGAVTAVGVGVVVITGGAVEQSPYVNTTVRNDVSPRVRTTIVNPRVLPGIVGGLAESTA